MITCMCMATFEVGVAHQEWVGLMQERVCNRVWASGASEVLGELQMRKGACA